MSGQCEWHKQQKKIHAAEPGAAFLFWGEGARSLKNLAASQDHKGSLLCLPVSAQKIFWNFRYTAAAILSHFCLKNLGHICKILGALSYWRLGQLAGAQNGGHRWQLSSAVLLELSTQILSTVGLHSSHSKKNRALSPLLRSPVCSNDKSITY